MIAIGKYRHYKGNEYEVIGIGTHTESSELYVIYKSLEHSHKSKIWIRPYAMFIELVKIEGVQIPRFKKIED